jgi:hypothetical protein
VTRADIRTEVQSGRWLVLGKQTVVVGNVSPNGTARRWIAIWESGSGAVLDGVAALHAAGLTGFDTSIIDVSMPKRNRHHSWEGVRRHRRRVMPGSSAVGLPRPRGQRVTARAHCCSRWCSSSV